jgi:hypothetical protein
MLAALIISSPMALWADATTHRDIGPVGPSGKGRSDYLAEVRIMGTKTGDAAESVKLHRLAIAEYRARRYSSAENLWFRAAKADPSWAKPVFNLACAASMQGKGELAVKYLEQALRRHPFVVMAWMKSDPDLAPARKTASFARLLDEYRWESLAGSAVILARVVEWRSDFKDGLAVLNFAANHNYSLTLTMSFDEPRGDDTLEASGNYVESGEFILLEQVSVNGPGDMMERAAKLKKLRLRGKAVVHTKDRDGSSLTYEAPSFIVEGPDGYAGMTFYGAGFITESGMEAY